jgi:hypothetical protein
MTGAGAAASAVGAYVGAVVLGDLAWLVKVSKT